MSRATITFHCEPELKAQLFKLLKKEDITAAQYFRKLMRDDLKRRNGDQKGDRR